MTLRAWLTPGLVGLHLLGALALGICLAGGLWQLGAYQAQQGSAIKEQAGATVPIEDVWGPAVPFGADLKSRVVAVSGRFGDAADQFWITSVDKTGRVGLVAPFFVEGSDSALLVVRGVTANKRTDDVPDVPTGPQRLMVSLQPSIPQSPPLDERRTTTSITVPSLLNELDFPLWSGYGIVTSGVSAPEGFELLAAPDPRVPWTVGLTNLAYTLQWWVFGLFTVFMWWRMARERLEQGPDSLQG